MKRQIVLITLLSFIIGIGNVVAQKGITFNVTYNNDSNSRSFVNKDIREFHAFQRDISDFSRAIKRDRVRDAKKIKRDILKKIRNEIRDTKEQIKYAKWELESSYGNGLHKKGSRSNNYSKRYGNRNVDDLKHLRSLERQLHAQEAIQFRLKALYLNGGRDFYQQGRRHEVLMKDFEEILRSEISFYFKEYRYRNRKN